MFADKGTTVQEFAPSVSVLWLAYVAVSQADEKTRQQWKVRTQKVVNMKTPKKLQKDKRIHS